MIRLLKTTDINTKSKRLINKFIITVEPIRISLNDSYNHFIHYYNKRDIKQEIRMETSFVYAYDNNDVETVMILLQNINLNRAKELISKIGNKFSYKNYWASESITEKMIKLLISLGANINEEYENHETPLSLALSNCGEIIITQFLLINGADLATGTDINKAYRRGVTILRCACCAFNLEKVKQLLEHKDIDVNKACESGRIAPIHIACERGYLEIAKELLKHKAIDVNNINSEGRTPLHLACEKGNLEIAKELIKSKDVDVNKIDSEGRTPLHFACAGKEENYLKIEILLVSSGAEINKCDNHGDTPLHVACRKFMSKEDQKIINLLLENGANDSINKENGRHERPLDIACSYSNLTIVKLLLENGAIIDEKLRYNYGTEILIHLDLAKNFDSHKQSNSSFNVPEAEKNNKKLCEFKYNLLTSKRAKNKLNFPNQFNSKIALAKFGNCRIITAE